MPGEQQGRSSGDRSYRRVRPGLARAALARAALARPARVRVRTVTGGIGLAAVLVLGMALLGGVGEPTTRPDPPVPGHAGPRTAIQPQLKQALLTGDEVVRTAVPTTPGVPVAVAPSGSPPAPPADPTVPVRGGLTELCRALLEDPAGLPRLWGAHPPQEVSSRQTRHAGGAVLRQTLGVFEPAHAPEAYGRLREAATGCDRLPVTLSDGTPVTVLLRELATGPGGRAESATAPDDADGFAVAITVEGGRGTRTGWLALDRVGPVVSVLRQLAPGAGPAGGVAAELADTRRAALGKLRGKLSGLLEVLGSGRGRTG